MKRVLGLAIVASLTGVAQAAPTTLQLREYGDLTPTAGWTNANFEDTWLNTAHDGTNYGTRDSAYISNAPAWNNVAYLQSVLIRVDHLFGSGGILPADAVITHASLELMTLTGDGVNNATVSRMTHDWTETGATFSGDSGTGPWTRYDGGNYGANIFSSDEFTSVNAVTMASGGGYRATVSFDITALMQDMLDSGNNYGVVITGAGGSFALSEMAGNAFDGTYDARPGLIITYDAVPEPASIGLAFMGALGMLARRRRA